MNKENLEIIYVKSKYPKIYKLLEIFVWVTSLILISIILTWYWIFLLNVQESYSNTVFLVATIILLYYIWWLIRWFEYIIFIFISVFHLFRYDKINFHKILFWDNNLNRDEMLLKRDIKNNLNPNDVIHWFIVPTYKEEESILIETLEALEKSNYDINKFAVTVAWEEWDKDNFLNVSKILKEKFDWKFWHLWFTIHPKWVPWELPGKWWNIKFSAKNEYKIILEKFNTTADKVLVTTLDADTNIDFNYPNVLTYTYIISDNRKYKSYQPMILFFNNFWEAPFFSKIVSLWNTFFLLFNSVKKYWMRNFSTHAQPLDALIEVDFWSCQTIVEDWHQYWRSYFGFKWHYECVPIYTKVYQDCNLNKSIALTAKAQYNQMRRWSHWAEDIAYVWTQWIDNFKQLPFIRTLYEFLRLVEWTIMWWTLHIILMSWMMFTLLKDIKLSTFISLWWTISVFINLSFITLICVLTLSMIFSPRNKLQSKARKIIELIKFAIVQIWFAGPTLFFFSWLPALHTQIALMLWKPMKKFNVTEKVRK